MRYFVASIPILGGDRWFFVHEASSVAQARRELAYVGARLELDPLEVS